MLCFQLSVFCLLILSVHSLDECKNYLNVTVSGVFYLEFFNWEIKGCTPAIPEDQGDCNTGYAYASASSIQLAYCARRSLLGVHLPGFPLNAEQIINCSTSFGNHGCDGGSAVNAFEYVKSTTGLQYDRTSFQCGHEVGGVKITGYHYYEDVSEQFLKDLLCSKGPLVVGIDASLASFRNKTGDDIYDDSNCKSGLADLNHDVLLVGFGTLPGGPPYWEFVNSYGPDWGAAGRGRIARANNRCGIRTRVSYPDIGYRNLKYHR